MTGWTVLRRDWRATGVVLGGLVVFVLVVYATVVAGGGWLLGRSSLPGDLPAVLATAVVALGFDPVQERLEAFAARRLRGGQPSPFEVLSEFSGAVSGQYAVEEVPAHMARVLAQGTGAAWAQVWLAVGDRFTLAASWPRNEDPDAGQLPADPRQPTVPGRRSLEVRHGFDLLGVLVLQERPHVRLTAAEERLFAGLAGQAGLVLRAAALRSQLEHRAEDLAVRAEELRRSRQRLVDAQDDERSRLERDIHDGAQQHLVALAVNLSLARTLAESAPEQAVMVLAKQEDAAREAVDTLVRLTRGIYPSLLSDRGLVAALEAAAALSPIPVTVTAADVVRLPSRVEAAAYFCCSEALQNALKHAGASAVRIHLCRGEDGGLVVTVSDDGRGFDTGSVQPGAGLRNMRDRLSALDGSLEAVSNGSGTSVVARIPGKAV